MRSSHLRVRRAALVVSTFAVAAVAAEETLPPVPEPAENAASEAKRALGKMLFFEEQLSSDDSVSCATCHVMANGGTDPRRGRNPGSNGVFGDLGDVLGSPGVAPMAADGTYRPIEVFGAAVQTTPRTAPTPFAAIWQDQILWDGRAGTTFEDPVTGEVVVPTGGALENQALQPLTNPVEMGHADRSLADVTAKLGAARPLALATNVPPDLAQALSGEPGYPELFARAFGDTEITATRIALAIATYERTLVPDQTRYDRYVAGDSSALTAQEVRGLDALTTSKCTACHVPPIFSDGTFRATGVRPPAEDRARANTTTYNADRGKWKVPTLRNVALKTSFFHDGQRTELGQAIDFYAVNGAQVANGVRRYNSPSGGHPIGIPSNQFVDNQDPVLSTITVTPTNAADINAFLTGALVDPRLASGTFPFDAPTLGSQRPGTQPIVHGTGHGSTASPLQVAIHTPAVAGSDGFTVSLTGGQPGAAARLVSWEEPSADGAVSVSDPIALQSADDVTFGNLRVPLADATPGARLHFAWQVEDSDAPGGVSVSPTATVVVFEQRPQFEGGVAVPAPSLSTVDDGDAYVSSARIAVDYGRTGDLTPNDSFSLTAWLGTAPGADVSSATVSVRVGGTDLVVAAPMDERGRIAAPGVGGSFDADTGRLQLTVHGADLQQAIVAPHSVPVRIEVAGAGLAHPVAATTLSFDAKVNPTGRTRGRFAFRASGTGNGAFHVTGATARRQDDGRVRIRLTAALDAPGPRGAWTPGSLTLKVGGAGGFQTTQPSLAPSAAGVSYVAVPGGDLIKLRIDVWARTLVLEAVGAFPELAGAAQGTRIEVPVTLSTKPAGGDTTIVSSTKARVLIGRARK
jgi:cytochrome c peroxidase